MQLNDDKACSKSKSLLDWPDGTIEKFRDGSENIDDCKKVCNANEACTSLMWYGS